MKEKTAADYSREIAALHRELDEETRRKMRLKAEKRAADEYLKADVGELRERMSKYSNRLGKAAAVFIISIIALLAVSGEAPQVFKGGAAILSLIPGIVLLGDPSPNKAQSYVSAALMMFISGSFIYYMIYDLRQEAVPEGSRLVIFAGVMFLLLLRCSIMYLKLLMRMLELHLRCTFRAEAKCTGCVTKAGCYTMQPRYSVVKKAEGPEDNEPAGDPAYLIEYRGEPIVLMEDRWNRFALPAAGEVRYLYIDPFRPDIFYDRERYRDELNYAVQQAAIPTVLVLMAGNMAAYAMSYFALFG